MAKLLPLLALAAYRLPFVVASSHNRTGFAGAEDNNNHRGVHVENITSTLFPSRHLAVREPVSFYVMGDAPYSGGDRDRFPNQVKNVPKDAEFMIHVGDMKGKDECRINTPYQLVSDAFLDHSVMPVFLTPGDNDYYDCDDWQMGWRRWSSYFLFFHQKTFRRFTSGGWVSKVLHQPDREENFSFRRRGVLFIGVHTVGLGNGIKSRKRLERLLRDDLDWTREQVAAVSHKAVVIFSHASPTKDHATYFDGLSELALESGRPFLYVHGDTHRWRMDRPFKATNILRVVVDQGGIADPVKITVDLNTDVPSFSFKRRSLSKKRFLREEGE